MPRAEYDEKVGLASNAEQTLADYENAAKEKDITALVDEAVAAG